MNDKQFYFQLDMMLLMPVMMSMLIPMIFEAALPSLCHCWRRKSRDRGDRGCCARCCCRRKRQQAEEVTSARNCCLRVMNCFMCDEDAGTGKHQHTPCLPDLDDGRARARSHRRVAPPPIHLTPDSLTYSVPLF